MRARRAPPALGAVLGLLFGAGFVAAQAPPGPGASGPSSASGVASAPAPTGSPGGPALSRPDGGKVWESCSEYVPSGAVRPRIEAHVPDRAVSGYELRLVVVVTHGQGETVLPEGFRVSRGSDAMRAIEAAGFVVPEPDGGSPPTIDRPPARASAGGNVVTTLSLPFVPLPEKSGRSELVLPPIPIAVGRANGQVMTLCTPPHAVTVEDPIVNELDPKVKGNPPPRPQREPWLLAKQLTAAALAALALAILGAWLIVRWQRRPRPEPPKPVIPPWVTALADLGALRVAWREQTLAADDLVDRVDDCVRRYLGDRYGFDGIESTSAEIRRWLGRVHPRVRALDAIHPFLDDTDLVKFAKVTARYEDCGQFLDRAEAIVEQTTPAPRPVATPTAPEPAT